MSDIPPRMIRAALLMLKGAFRVLVAIVLMLSALMAHLWGLKMIGAIVAGAAIALTVKGIWDASGDTS